MLTNVKISRQVVAGFGIILIMLVIFAGFTWSQLKSMASVHEQAAQAEQRALTMADVAYGVSEADRALLRFLGDATSKNADAIIGTMEQLRQLAMQAEGLGSKRAGQLISLGDRYIEELRPFTIAYIERSEKLKTIWVQGIEQRRNLDRLQTEMQARDASGPATAVLEANKDLLLIRARIEYFTSSHDSSAYEEAVQLHDRLQALFARITAAPLRAEERELLTTILDGTAEIWALAESIQDVESRIQSQLATVKGTSDDIMTLAADMRTAAVSMKNDLDIQAANLSKTTIFSVLSGVALAIAIGGLIAGVLSRHLSRRLSQTVIQTTQLAEGNLSVDITGKDHRNELGELARALLVFRENAIERQRLSDETRRIEAAAAAKREAEQKEQARVVQDIGAGLERLAKGDLTQQIDNPASDPFPAGYESLREAYNSVIGTLSETLSRITSVADQVRGGSDEITSAAHDLSSRAETQAATLEESAAALNEMSESVRSTAERARLAEQASLQNREVAEASSAVVRNAIAAMKDIEKSSEQITRIIGVIDDIAFQTNLLALNAGVEAARAGDAGRGFAVVASEVRGLAQRASESAREIKTLISDSALQVQAGSQLVGRTGQSLDVILTKAHEVSEQISAIAVAANEQAIGLTEINSGVNQLDQVTQQNAAVAEESNAAAVSLQQRADDLMNEIARFRINDVARALARRVQAPQGEPAPLRIVAGLGHGHSHSQGRLLEF